MVKEPQLQASKGLGTSLESWVSMSLSPWTSWSWVPRNSVTESSDHPRRKLGGGGLAARVEAGAVGAKKGWVLGRQQRDKLLQP